MSELTQGSWAAIYYGFWVIALLLSYWELRRIRKAIEGQDWWRRW